MSEPMTLEQARAWAETAPWRPIQSLKARLDGRDPCEPGAAIPCQHQRDLFGPDEPIADPHWYLILGRSVQEDEFWRFTRLIRAAGYKARYVRPYNPKPMVNDYLDIGDWVYWHIYPNQLCRTKVEWHQHEPIPEQPSLFDNDDTEEEKHDGA